MMFPAAALAQTPDSSSLGSAGNQCDAVRVVPDIKEKEEPMRIKLVIAAAALVASVTPSLAAEFFIVQDTSTKRCTIVEQRPTTPSMVVVGPGGVYATRVEAESAMKTVKVCESGGTVGGPMAPAPR
jgi:hypothetical protein